MATDLCATYGLPHASQQGVDVPCPTPGRKPFQTDVCHAAPQPVLLEERPTAVDPPPSSSLADVWNIATTAKPAATDALTGHRSFASSRLIKQLETNGNILRPSGGVGSLLSLLDKFTLWFSNLDEP